MRVIKDYFPYLRFYDPVCSKPLNCFIHRLKGAVARSVSEKSLPLLDTHIRAVGNVVPGELCVLF